MEFIRNSESLFEYSAEINRAGKDRKVIVQDEEKIEKIFTESSLKCDDRFSLKIESYLLKLAYSYNKILSLSNSRTRILAHQVESTHRIINSLNKRFLIADEVGLGKTIEAGLVIKELICRYNYKRILIVCPASLLLQWQNEMISKFNEHFEIIDRKFLNRVSSGRPGNPWKKFGRIICSLDFIKNNSFREDLKDSQWDAVIFDEAHRLRRDSRHSTHAYNVAEIISERTEALLLLSATPFRGKLEELYYLIALIDRNILGPYNSFFNEYCIDDSNLASLRKKLASVVIRRTKRDIGGFTGRFARTIKFDLYPDERNLYDKTTDYVIREFNRSMREENRAVGFVMTIFQKLLDSSSYALLSALKNRAEKLRIIASERNLKKEEKFCGTAGGDAIYSDDEDIEEICSLHNSKSLNELKEEVKTLEKLIAIAERIRVNKKGEKLEELIESLAKRGCKKILIFTQFRTTQNYLKNLLSRWKVEIFNGSMNRDEKEEAIARFKNEAHILIATESGGEGRNMQFCNIIINYDLPWSPLKIEQRIGRVHRFGQKRDVYIYNFSTKDTVAERVLEVLKNKLRLFEESIGAPDMLLGQIEDEIELSKIFMEMAAGRRKKKEIESEISVRIENARKSYEKLSDLTITDRIDFNYDDYYRITEKERRFSNERIEKFVNNLQITDRCCSEFLGNRNGRTMLYPVKKRIMGGKKFCRYGTFRSETALENERLEFLALGHPIIDELVEYCQSEDFGGFAGIKFFDYKDPFVGIVFNYIAAYKHITAVEEFVPVAVDLSGKCDSFELDDIESELIQQNLSGIEKFDVRIEDYMEEVAEIIRKYGDYYEKSRKRLIEKADIRAAEICDDMEFQIDPEIEKIKESYSRRIGELKEKLQLQESRMKWYGKDMKGAITRTAKMIQKSEMELREIVARYSGYSKPDYTLRLLSAGVVISPRS